ncbi:MAG: DEAD/DEAH box helicase [bacterium]
MENSTPPFHPIIRKWFKEKVGRPTDIQSRAWPKIAEGSHVLISAPTGSGKTLAAFLWAIDQLVSKKRETGHLNILYVSPLKALNNDVRRNLLKPLSEIEKYFKNEGVDFPPIRVLTRSGDTPSDERYKMMRMPPEILITTPESLNILLTSRNSRRMLEKLDTVILDEIHAVLCSKRGTHLITACDRLVPICGEFQRIALSATIKPLNKACEFIAGYKKEGLSPDYRYERRKIYVIQSQDEKQYQVKVSFLEKAKEEIVNGSWWPSLVKEFKKIIALKKSTLFFANSRRLTEKVTHLINENEPEEIAYSHHGSLSKEFRLAVEQKLKNGELKAIVATNSLELGIDIGDLDQVVLIQSPFSISSGIQRIGRAGHSVGETSRGIIFPTHGMDFINAAVMAKSVMEKDIEEIEPVELPLDVLSQIILSETSSGTWDIDELFYFLKTSYPYRNLSRNQYMLVLEMMAGRYSDSRIRELRPLLSIDKLDNTVKAKEHSSLLVYMSGGTIPDRGYFDLRIMDSRLKIGELDEEFVWERKLGETFSLGTQLWRIEQITHNDVYVVPAKNTLNIIPFWKADEQNRDFHFSARISSFLEMINAKLYDENLAAELEHNYFMEESPAKELTGFLKFQKEVTKAELPHRHHVLIEHFDDPFNKTDKKQVIIHTLWGGRINQPFAFALSAAWETKYKYPLEIFSGNDAIMLMLPHEFSAVDIFKLVTPENLEILLRKKLEQTGFFGARFRENAGRALLLPKPFKKRMPLWLNRLRAKKLFDAVLSYEDFPILLETWRGCLQDEFDLKDLVMLLDEIHDGKTRLSEIITNSPSPFADGLIWKQTNKYMYADDTPESMKRSGLKQDLIKEIVFSTHLRPKIPKELIDVLDKKLKRTAEGYAPSSIQDILDWVKERLLIPENEWKDLLSACERDNDLAGKEVMDGLSKKITWVTLPGSKTNFIHALELKDRITACFEAKKDDTSLFDFLNQWLMYYGPIKKSEITDILGIADEVLLEQLEEENLVVMDTISENAPGIEICNSENLEILLRMARKQRQPQFNAMPLEKLPLFLAAFQNIAVHGKSMENLKECLDQLFGYPAPAAGWEEFIFPCRVKPYYSSWLDTLIQSSGLIWFGCGKKKTSFCFTEDTELFSRGNKDTNSEILPSKNGKYNFYDISKSSKMGSKALTEKLWELAWRGKITNDSYQTLRKGILNNFTPVEPDKSTSIHRRSGLKRWEATRPIMGNWYYIYPGTDEKDIIEQTELTKDRIRQLFKRYGILFRELVENEVTLLQWRNIFRTLRLMELSGEILSGYFFEGISGLQFISYEAFRLINAGANNHSPLPEDYIYWINACDPASLCGIKFAGANLPLQKLPSRISSNYLVYHGPKPVLIVKRNGRELIFYTGSDNPRVREYFSIFKVLLTRDFNPLKRIIIEKINEGPAEKSEYVGVLKESGFKATHKGLEIWRSEAI